MLRDKSADRGPEQHRESDHGSHDPDGGEKARKTTGRARALRGRVPFLRVGLAWGCRWTRHHGVPYMRCAARGAWSASACLKKPKYAPTAASNACSQMSLPCSGTNPNAVSNRGTRPMKTKIV